MSDLEMIVYLTLLLYVRGGVKEGSSVEGDEVNFWVEVRSHVALFKLLTIELNSTRLSSFRWP